MELFKTNDFQTIMECQLYFRFNCPVLDFLKDQKDLTLNAFSHRARLRRYRTHAKGLRVYTKRVYVRRRA